MSFAIDIDATAFGHAAGLLEREPLRIERELRALTQRRAKLTKEALQRATPVSHPQGNEPEHSPHMRDLWHQETTGPSESVVFNEASYSMGLFTGTSAHEIEPRPGTAHGLHFYAGGTEVWGAQHVDHPGTIANPNLLRALDDQLTKAQGDLFDYGLAEVSRLAEACAARNVA